MSEKKLDKRLPITREKKRIEEIMDSASRGEMSLVKADLNDPKYLPIVGQVLDLLQSKVKNPVDAVIVLVLCQKHLEDEYGVEGIQIEDDTKS